MRSDSEMLEQYEETERIAARIAAIEEQRPDLAREADRLLKAWTREKLAGLERGARLPKRRRRSSFLCRIGRHDWEAFQFTGPGISFRARCRRPGCRVVKVYKTRALGPTEVGLPRA